MSGSSGGGVGCEAGQWGEAAAPVSVTYQGLLRNAVGVGYGRLQQQALPSLKLTRLGVTVVCSHCMVHSVWITSWHSPANCACALGHAVGSRDVYVLYDSRGIRVSIPCVLCGLHAGTNRRANGKG